MKLTPNPVPPLFINPFCDAKIAIPAISTWAHFTPYYTNFFKNHAAEHPPPYLEEGIFDKSATFPLINAS